MISEYLKVPTQVRNYAVSPSSGNFSGPGDVTGVVVTLTTYGRPVLIFLAPDLTTNPAGSGYSSSGTVSLALKRDSGSGYITISHAPDSGGGAANLVLFPTTILSIDPVAAGTYSWKLNLVGTSSYVKYCRLVAWEIGT